MNWKANDEISINDIKGKMGIRNFVKDEDLFQIPYPFEISKYTLLEVPLFPIGDPVDNIDVYELKLEATIVLRKNYLEKNKALSSLKKTKAFNKFNKTKTFSIKYAGFRAILGTHFSPIQTNGENLYQIMNIPSSDFAAGKLKGLKTISLVEEYLKSLNTNVRIEKDDFISKIKIWENGFPKLNSDLKQNFKVQFQLHKPYKKVKGASEQFAEFKVLFTHKNFHIEKTKLIKIQFADFRPALNNIFIDQKPSTQKLEEYNKDQKQSKKSNEFKFKPFTAMKWIYENVAESQVKEASNVKYPWKNIVKAYALPNIEGQLTRGYDLDVKTISKRFTPYLDRELGYEITFQGTAKHKKSNIVKTKNFKVFYTISDALPSEVHSTRSYEAIKNDVEFKRLSLWQKLGWNNDYKGHPVIGLPYSVFKFQHYYAYFDFMMVPTKKISPKDLDNPYPYISAKIYIWHKHSGKDNLTVAKIIKVYLSIK